MGCDIFLSYVTSKDQFNAISEFRVHIEHHVRRKTGKRLTVFQDKHFLRGGDKWANVLSDELVSAKLLIILLSPGWLNSEWCRREYTLFCKSGSSRPIFPLLWDRVLDRHVEKGSEADAIFSELKTYQVRDWTRFSDADWQLAETNVAAGKLAEEIDELLAS
jgi:hypothetical protein